MIILLYNILALLYAVFFLGNLYCAWKIYRLNHRWRRYVGITYAVNALIGLTSLITLGFGPRPTTIIWWIVILRLFVFLIAIGSAAYTTMFFMGLLNGVKQSDEGTTNA